MRTEVRGWFWQGRATSGAAAPASQSAARDPHAASPPDRPGFAIGGVVPRLQPVDQTTRGCAATTVPPPTAPTRTVIAALPRTVPITPSREMSAPHQACPHRDDHRHPRHHWRSWRSSAARCSTLPKPSTDLGPHPTHLSVPGAKSARRSRSGEIFKKRRNFQKETRYEAVTQRSNLPKKELVTRRSCSGEIFKRLEPGACERRAVNERLEFGPGKLRMNAAAHAAICACYHVFLAQ